MIRPLLTKVDAFLSEARRATLESVALLVLRLGAGGGMLLGHGWGKLTSYGERADSFPDPLGVSSPVSLALAIFAEVGCAALVALGFATRLASIPLIFTMLMAAFVIHADDPWRKKEMAFLYLLPFVSLLLTGPGRLSLDALVAGWLKRDAAE